MDVPTFIATAGASSRPADNPLTMSSREIADLVEARHNDVVATIERQFEKGVLRESRRTLRPHHPPGGGRPTNVYDLTKRDTLVVASGYDDALRAKIIDRWIALESERSSPSAAPVPSLAASAREARLFLKQALDIGKIAGLSGNQLLIAASRSTHRAVGFDMLGSMEITHLVAPVQDPLVIPSKIGQDLGISAVQVNHLLQEIGFQTGDRDHKDRPFWKLTPAGEEFGGTLVDVERSNRTGPAQQLRWPSAVVGVLRAHMDRRTG